MFARFKALANRFKTGEKKEQKEGEYGVGVPPENEAIREDVEERRTKVAEYLEPINENWTFIERTLLWKNALPACICFFVISGVFWKFISMKLRRIALIFGAFLLANGLSSDMRAASWDFCERNLNLQIHGDPVLPFNFDDLCLFLATTWAMFAHAWKSFQNLSDESPPKFYCILAVGLFALLAMFTYFPVLEFVYISVCLVFFYPAMRHYGIMERIDSRIRRLTNPVMKHWQNNQTKRTRSIAKANFSKQQDDSDDEFILEKNNFTAKVLSSVIPDDDVIDDPNNESTTYNERSRDEVSRLDYDEDYYTESHFEENLAMPSMSQFDSLMEPYDAFHSGLRFPDYTDSSRIDTHGILKAAANNIDTDDEIEDLPYEPETRRLPSEGIEYHDGRSMIYQPSRDEDRLEDEIERYPGLNPMFHDSRFEHQSDTKKEEWTRAVEADFEFLEHSDVDAEMPANSQQNLEVSGSPSSYTNSGIATVSKWLGYQ